jgi:hypothetical protein
MGVIVTGGSKDPRGAWLWDGSSITKLGVKMNQDRQWHCGVYSGEYLYVVSGDATGSVERLNVNDPVSAFIWEEGGTLATPRSKAACTYVSGHIYVVGGTG